MEETHKVDGNSISDKYHKVLKWICSRLLHKDKLSPNDVVVLTLKELIDLFNKNNEINIKFCQQSLNRVIQKYYFDFMLEKEEKHNNTIDFNIGYTEKERIVFRDRITNIVNDLLNEYFKQRIIE